jgi:hypothetical protein
MVRAAAGFLIAVAWAPVAPAFAADVQPPSDARARTLDDLRTTLARLREEAPMPKAPPDAGALVTLAKRQLREWVERQLPPTDSVDVGPLNARLKARLQAADLVGPSDCSNPAPGDASHPGPPESRRSEACGYVGDMRVEQAEGGRDGPYLTLTTAFDNAWCGVDGSAYLFQRKDGGWRLVWESEENAEAATYSPAPITRVLIARRFTLDGEKSPPPPLVLTLGSALGCEGTWGSVRYRLWRVHDGEPRPPPLLSRTDGFWMGNDRYPDARLLPDDLLVEYRNRGVDGGVHNRTFIAHFRIGDDDKIQRVAPVALNPRDFVDEWLTQPWQYASAWTEPRLGGRIRQARERILNGASNGFVSGTFAGPPLRCKSDPNLWQVGFTPDEGKDFSDGPALYFVVRWMAPYRFTLVDAARGPRPRCNLADPMPDATDTLFSATGAPWPTANPFAPDP